MSSSPPLVVADRYRLVSPLGQGGMGRVWRATDVVLHRDVAIKELVPPPGLTAGERQEMRERSLREARAIARLNNVNVVRVFDVLRTDADPWIVMEYVASRSLQDTLASDGPFPPVRAAEIGLGVLGALRAAHRAGVVHRDVKPGNVLIGDDGRVVLTDFGLATVPGDPNVTRTGLVLGSPAYIAPERAREGTAGPAADLWSLGATLYAAVEGASPFARPSAIATLAALATENPPPARNAGPLKPVLNGLLRKDPTHRINAEEAERLLNRAAGRRARTIFPMSPTMRRPGVGRERPGALISPTGSAPVVPGPRPPVAPPRQTDPPGRPPASGARPAAGGGRPPIYVPGKASVGPAADTPTRADGPQRDAPRLDATRLDTPAVRDDKTTTFGTPSGSPTASGQPPAARSAPPATAPNAPSARTNRGERGTFTASDVAAARRGQTAPETGKPPAADPTTVMPTPDATRAVGSARQPANPSPEAAAAPGAATAAPGETAVPETASTTTAPETAAQTSEAQTAADAAPQAAAAATSAPGAATQTAEAPPTDTAAPLTANPETSAAGTKAAATETAATETAPTETSATETPGQATSPATDGRGKPGRSTTAKSATRKQKPGAKKAVIPAPSTPADAESPADAEAAAPPADSSPAAALAGTTAEPTTPGTEAATAAEPESTPQAVEQPARPAPESADQPAGLSISPTSPAIARPARPAWRPMDARPTPRGVTVLGTRLTYRQAAIGAGILLLVLALLITLVIQAVGNGDDNPSTPVANPPMSPTWTDTKPPSNAASTAPSAAPSSAPSASPTTAPGTVTLPAGWKWYDGSATGDAPAFRLPIPKNASVSGSGTELQFRWNNRLLILGRTKSPKADALADWKDQEAARKGTYRSYQLVRLASTSYRDFESVADWEFYYVTSNNNKQHVLRRNIRVDDKSAFSLNWYVPDTDWNDAKSDLQLLFQGFQPR